MMNKKLKQLDVNSKQINILALLLLITIRVRCLFKLVDYYLCHIALRFFVSWLLKGGECDIQFVSFQERENSEQTTRKKRHRCISRHNGFYLSLD